MNRRDAIRVTLLGVPLGSALLACARDTAAESDAALMESIADTLLPTTASSPGARDAGAGAAIQLFLRDCYDDAARQKLTAGLRGFRQDHPGFVARPVADRERILRDVDAAARRTGDAHWFHLARELSLRGYFTSEIGMTKALRWLQIPGRFDGCVPLTPGQPAWG